LGLVSLMVTGTIAVALTGCSDGGGEPDADLPFAGQTLTVMNWQGYGSDSEWTMARFEELTGAKVENVYRNSDADGVNILENGGLGTVDVALVNHGYLDIMREADLLQPIDTDLVPSYADVYPDLTTVESLSSDGEIYGVPWVWGYTSLASDQAVTGEIDSWDAMWDDAYSGKVAFYDDPQTAIQTSAFHLGLDPADPDLDLDAIKADLLDLKPNVALYWTGSDPWLRAFSTKQAVIGNTFLALTKQVEDPTVTMVIPEEGAVGWLDTWAIVKDSPNYELASAWVEFMTSEEFQTWFITEEPTLAAFPANSLAPIEEYATYMNSDTSAADIPSLDFIAVSPETLEIWTQLWQEVKAS
jgi:spermidine/putrescine transport system substrate-binding protein